MHDLKANNVDEAITQLASKEPPLKIENLREAIKAVNKTHLQELETLITESSPLALNLLDSHITEDTRNKSGEEDDDFDDEPIYRIIKQPFSRLEHVFNLRNRDFKEQLLNHPVIRSTIIYKWIRKVSGVYFYELVMNSINLICFTIYMLNFIPPRVYKESTCEIDSNVFQNSSWMQFGFTSVSVDQAYETSQILSYILYAVIAFKYLVAPIYFSFYSTKMIYDLFLKKSSKIIKTLYILSSPILAILFFPLVTLPYLFFPIVYFLLSAYYVKLWLKDKLQEIPEKAIKRILLKASELSIVHSLAAISSILQILTVTKQSDNDLWNSCGRKEQWQFNAGVIALGFNFLGISLLLTQFPKIGIYPRLFEYVFRIIIKLLISFVHVFVGLGVIGYLLLLGSFQSFKTWYVGILKVLIMTTGEITFDDLVFNLFL